MASFNEMNAYTLTTFMGHVYRASFPDAEFKWFQLLLSLNMYCCSRRRIKEFIMAKFVT